jgi:hypothetical protein
MAGDIEVVYQRLTRPVIAGTPFFALGAYPGPMTARQRGRLLDAAIVSLLEALRGHPKAAAVTTVLLQQVGAVSGAAGGVARVKKRGQRAYRAASDPFTLTASLVSRLRDTYTAVSEEVNPPEPLPDRSGIWTDRGRRWGTSGPHFRRAFQAFCRVQGATADVRMLEYFERGAVSPHHERGGPRAVRQFLRRWAAR